MAKIIIFGNSDLSELAHYYFTHDSVHEVVAFSVNEKYLGKKFDIGSFTYINSHYGIEIQDNVLIGSHCSIYSHSTIDNKKGPVVLEKNCKIGTHSTIMPNVTIGENSIVGSYSFVTQNIPKDQIWVGVPARFKSFLKNL